MGVDVAEGGNRAAVQIRGLIETAERLAGFAGAVEGDSFAGGIAEALLHGGGLLKQPQRGLGIPAGEFDAGRLHEPVPLPELVVFLGGDGQGVGNHRGGSIGVACLAPGPTQQPQRVALAEVVLELAEVGQRLLDQGRGLLAAAEFAQGLR